MKNKEVRSVSVELRATGDKNKTVAGVPIVFNKSSNLMWDWNMGHFREIILPEAVIDAMERSNPVLNVDHKGFLAKLSSGTLRHERKEDGVHIEADIPNSRADIVEFLSRGDISTMSFAFTLAPDGDEWNLADDGIYERTIKKMEHIYDYSLITSGEAYSDTSVAMRNIKNIKNTGDEIKLKEESRQIELRKIKLQTLKLES